MEKSYPSKNRMIRTPIPKVERVHPASHATEFDGRSEASMRITATIAHGESAQTIASGRISRKRLLTRASVSHRPDRVRLVAEETMALYDLRVTVERIEGRSVCGLAVGDYFELTESSRLRIPDGRHFCIYALQSVLPLLAAKQRQLPETDWLEMDSHVACPDPDERVIMRIERIGRRTLRTDDLT